MLFFVYSLHDTVSGVFLPPFHVRKPVEALRAIEAALRSSDSSSFSLNPSAFECVHVGWWDDETGTLYGRYEEQADESNYPVGETWLVKNLIPDPSVVDLSPKLRAAEEEIRRLTMQVDMHEKAAQAFGPAMRQLEEYRSRPWYKRFSL